MEKTLYKVNPGKQSVVGEGDKQFYCYAIETPVITEDDELSDVISRFVSPITKKGDIIFVSEKMIACIQGRSIPLYSIKAGFWAKLLSGFVTKTPAGIGLGMPQTMQCAIDECRLFRILFAAAIGLFGKTIGFDGWFYKIAGPAAAAIDGPCSWTIYPYNHSVVLAPKEPDKTAEGISAQLGDIPVLIVDINDLGGSILGRSHDIADEQMLLGLLKQNPLGQASQSTPIGVLRAVNN